MGFSDQYRNLSPMLPLLLPLILQSVVPLERAHAHNDYLHRRPLQDALARGFCSVEADIHLVDGRLLVAHDRPATRPDRRLDNLYLEPLRARVAKNGGRVFAKGPDFTLLIDVKGDARKTWPVLRAQLAKFGDILTQFTPDGRRPGPVTAILSGGVPADLLAAEKTRYCALDAGYAQVSPQLSPLCSRNWRREFRWRGSGAFPAAERARLRANVARVHAQGRRLRYWGGPNRHAYWRELWAAGVDLIHTDDLRGLQTFLLEKHRRAQPPDPWRPAKHALPRGIRAWSLATAAPLRAWLVTAELWRPEVTSRPLLSRAAGGKEPLTALATTSKAIVAVNAHYFHMHDEQCTVRDWFVLDGTEVSPAPSRLVRGGASFPIARAAVYWRSRLPAIGWVHARGKEVLELAAPFQNTRDLPVAEPDFGGAARLPAVRHSVSAGPMLVAGGKPALTRVEEQLFRTSDVRHPRTAVGIRDNTLLLLVVDGRQKTSHGATLRELADMFLALGATHALNLDGGGSSTLVIGGELVNAPSGGRQRPVPSAIGILHSERLR